MTRIVVLGKNGDTSITNTIVRTLGKDFCIEVLSKSGIVRTKEEMPAFILWDTDHISKIDDKDTILIFKRNYDGVQVPSISCKCTVILDASNMCALSSLLQKQNVAICCGMSSRDTLSLASVDENGAVVSLQRELTSVQGSVIEPCDVPVTLTQPESHYTILAAAAVLLLTEAHLEKNSFLM